MATMDGYEQAITSMVLSGQTYTLKEAGEIEKALRRWPTPINGYRHKWVGVTTGVQWHFVDV